MRSRLLVLTICLIGLIGCEMTTIHGLLAPGNAVPQLQATKWLNGTAPTWEALRGQVVVLDIWAHW